MSFEGKSVTNAQAGACSNFADILPAPVAGSGCVAFGLVRLDGAEFFVWIKREWWMSIELFFRTAS